jgi:hypothetical protein
MTMSAATLDQVLDVAMQLPLDQQEMLLEILKRRQSERNRREIADDAKTSIAEFRAAYTVAQSPDEVIADLHHSLDE